MLYIENINEEILFNLRKIIEYHFINNEDRFSQGVTSMSNGSKINLMEELTTYQKTTHRSLVRTG